MSETTEYDLDEVMKETVAAITAKLGRMTVPQLHDLRRRESSHPDPRTTLLAAIETELDGRPADEGESGDGAETEGAPQADADEIATLKATISAQADRIFQLETELNAEKAKATKAAPAKAAAKPRTTERMKQAKEVALPTEAFRVVCVNDEGGVIASLPPLLFNPHDLEAVKGKGGKVTGLSLKQPIAFPQHIGEVEVSALYLAPIKGSTGLRAELVVPILVGGGRSVELPAGHLAFEAEAEAEADAAA